MSRVNHYTYVIGITGQAASGKSTLAQAFVELGAELIDADEVAKDLVNSNHEIHERLKETFGIQFFDTSGQLKRRELGNYVFNDAEKLNQLNVIVWPFMIRVILDRIDAFKKKDVPLVVIDMAVLFETDIDAACDQVIGVIAPYNELADRMQNNRGWTEQEVVKRLEAQQSDESFRAKVDIVVENDGDTALLFENAKNIYLNLDIIRNNVC